ncbi:unnamed protein product [Aphis gossypii]|uniref:Gustatory receptor n=1 Tax=Aphis gossypii TaxID=80765 RepID=A0A9P0IYK9_APHGO|nr:unnamed protein product [Aphis gossypii]
MYSTWFNFNLIYYVGKLFGLYPFAGNYKNLSFCYSLVLWIALCYASIKVLNNYYEYSDTLPSSQKLLKYVIKFETYVTLNTLVQCSSNYKAQQFYVINALLIWTYHIFVAVVFFNDIFFLLFMWSIICLSTTIAILPYIICIRMLRHRYKLANKVFKNSISNPTITTKCFYPTEVHNVFIELRNLTEEVKTYYAFHALLIIMESTLLIAAVVTKLVFSYTNNISTELIYNRLFLIFCILKFQFVFFLVREAHNTIQESKKTVLIAHDTLCITSNTGIIKEFEVFVLSCWNNPIIFDVYDFFDLDYALLQSIIASIVTYTVVLVQIQLAISSQ